MSKKMDRQGVRRPADLEQKYAFAKRFEETKKTAETATKIATSVAETENSLSLKVQTIENDLNGEGGVHAQLALKVETDADGKLVSKVHIEGGFLTIETDNFTLTEDGTITATNGTFEGKVTSNEVDVKGGTFGGWTLGLADVTDDSGNVERAYALYSAEMYEERDGRPFTYRVFLTAKGVYVDGRYNTSGESGASYHKCKTWLEICGG